MPISELKTESLSTTTLSTSGALSVASLASAGAITGASVASAGAITAASAAISGDLTVTGATPFRKARAVSTANVANLASFNVSTNTDGVTLVQNDIVLLARQTTAAQNGPYVVGVVAAGVAPLTRPAWFAAGSTVKTGFVLEVGGEGSTYKNTTWKSMRAADSFVVDTNDGEFFPQFMSGSGALSSGQLTITTVPIRTNTAAIFITRVGAGSGVTNTVECRFLGGVQLEKFPTSHVTIVRREAKRGAGSVL